MRKTLRDLLGYKMDSEDLKKNSSKLAVESVNSIKPNKLKSGFPK